MIPTRNGGSLFERVLEKIRGQLVEGGVEIVVVDSGSSDQTVEVARRHGARLFQIAPRDFNHGLTRNHGIEQARGEIVVLMTQDALPANPHLMEKLIEPFDDPLVAGVFARQLPRPDADPVTRRNLENWITGGDIRQVRYIQDSKDFERLSPMERYAFCVFDNVCSAVRKSVWQEIPFPRAVFGEDIEWGQRTLRAGWKIVFEPQAVVEHSHQRPVAYEYRRTYICHRRLFELFGLQTVPSLKSVLRSIPYGVLASSWLVLRSGERPWNKLADLVRIPFLTVLTVWAQYAGARDEKRRKPLPARGV
ncbi:MAG: glycosyltransferase [Anaerolineales bacterium]